MKKILFSAFVVLAIAIAAFAAQPTATVIRTFEVPSHVNTLPVAANVVIYKGSAVGSSNGYATQLIAGDSFKGFAEQLKDNTDGADGAVNINVRSDGIALLSVASVAVTDEGKPVFARDGNTFVLGQEVTNSRIGTVHRFVASGSAMVRFEADSVTDLTGTTILTDSSGGVSNNTLVAITFPTALTDSGGGTADGTVASAAAPTTLTDSTGGSGTHDDTLILVTNFSMSVEWNGSSVYPSLADGLLLSNSIAALKQNSSDTAQKIIELVTLATTQQNNLKEVTTELATTRAALTNMVNNTADLAAKVNELINAQK